MPTWATADDVRARVAYATIGTTSKPTTAQVEQWLDEAEARIRGVLAAQGLPTTYTDTDAVNILTVAATDYAEGHILNTWSSQDGNTGARPGDVLIDKFDAFLEQLRARTIQLAGELAAGDVAESVRRVRSYWTDNEDGLSISAGDFAPAIGADWKD